MTKVNGTSKYRLEQLEKKYTDLEDKIDEIRTNHLPHLQLELVQIKTRINVLTAVNVGAIIIAMLIQWVFLK